MTGPGGRPVAPLAAGARPPNLVASISPGSALRSRPARASEAGAGLAPVVMKFGGTSLADASRIADAVEIVARTAERHAPRHVIVVVSALAGVTNALEKLVDGAASEHGWEAALAALELRHFGVIDALGLESDGQRLHTETDRVFGKLARLLRGVELLGEATPKTRDAIIGAGERVSGPIFQAACRGRGLAARYADAGDFIVTDEEHGEARLSSAATRRHTIKALGSGRGVTVVPGFVAVTSSGRPTTLGRGGSDYTAAIIGASLGTPEVEIWSDVDGVMSADPAKVGGARSLAEVGFQEVIELAHFGAQVVFEPTIHAAREAGLTLIIKNTRNPEFLGTRIVERPGRDPAATAAKGIASLSGAALIRVGGRAMRTVGGARERLLRAVASTGAPPPLLVQIGSGQGVSLVVKCVECGEITAAVRKEFELEIAAGRVEPPELVESLALVAVVGADLESKAGVSGPVFAALAASDINARGIALGASGKSLVFLVDAEREGDAIRAVHDALFPSRSGMQAGERAKGGEGVRVAEARRARARLYLAGVGGVGGELVRQIDALSDSPKRPPFRVVGLANSRRALVAPDGGGGFDADSVDLLRRGRAARGSLVGGGQALAFAALEDERPGRVFVDCTANTELAACYRALLDSGASVVASNKIGFSASGALWDELRGVVASGGPLYFETTVGAGLPVLRTISELVAAGDRIHRIEGLLSGTLSYLMSEVHSGRRASEVLLEAHARGMTEPDPRIDLMGSDVARKAVILARVAGFECDPDRLAPAPALPVAVGRRDDGLEDFWENLPLGDRVLSERVREAKRTGRRLAYVATVARDTTEVGLKEVPATHPFAGAPPGVNVVSIWTDRYSEAPLTIQGMGAGPEVTAAGVLTDILAASMRS